ncbi:MAG TPA: pyruvate formate lyase-activating protein [Candidatus Caccenecus avistercoris]|nr:pyruvate formate lyase-activating protein [Candidatus Caccenecus avistercoris]
MMQASVNSIETFGLVDGPGIRTVIFLNGCKLRCLYCHNPEMWQMGNKNYTVDELVAKILRNKPYFKRNNGGVTFSGGEPLLQVDFLLEICKKLKEEGIHIALDTAGVGVGKYEEILSLIDLVLLDIKHSNKDGYKKLTGMDISESEKFIEYLNKSGKPVWIRQVIVPGIMDNDKYLQELAVYLLKIKNIEKIEFLPFHHLGFSKYENLKLENPLKNVPEMNVENCQKLYERFMNIYNNLKDDQK